MHVMLHTVYKISVCEETTTSCLSLTLAILVSEEHRNKKPYSITVQFVPYSSLKDQYIRDLTTGIKAEMVRMDLKPVGRYSKCFFSFFSTFTHKHVIIAVIKLDCRSKYQNIIFKFNFLYLARNFIQVIHNNFNTVK